MVNGVAGYLIPGDISFLFRLAASLPAGGCYVEIGSWMGLSSIVYANGLLANLNLSARISCIDTWEGSVEHAGSAEVQAGTLFQTFLSNVNASQMDVFIKAMRGRSVDVAKNWSGPDIDMIFIDGDHSLEGCYSDIIAWLPRLKKGGRMIGHDCVPRGGVESALHRIEAEMGITFRVHDPPMAHYIWELDLG